MNKQTISVEEYQTQLFLFRHFVYSDIFLCFFSLTTKAQIFKHKREGDKVDTTNNWNKGREREREREKAEISHKKINICL